MLGFAASALALDKVELDYRINKLTAKFVALQQKPDKRIPAETLRKARGIVLMERTKAGFLFAYQGGNGVALVKDAQSEQWSPAAFVRASEASLGFQIGGQQSFVVILLMNNTAKDMLTDLNYKFGGEASGTAGQDSAGAEGVVSSIEAPVLVYSDRKGLYGGAAIKGDTLAPDTDANVAYYEQAVTMKEILFENKVKPTEATSELIKKITEYFGQ